MAMLEVAIDTTRSADCGFGFSFLKGLNKVFFGWDKNHPLGKDEILY